MAIDWYPGHMAKARREIAAVIGKIDVVIELLDARLPQSSANPILTELRRTKPCIKLLNKQDLADPAVTRAWVRHFERAADVRALPIEARKAADLRTLPKLCRRLAPNRGRPTKPARVVIVGIPNVGKSTLINTLAGRKLTKVGDKPAVTKKTQQIDLKNGIVLSDTPGLLWPGIDNQKAAFRLAASGAVGVNAFDPDDIALFALEFLAKRYPGVLAARYKITDPTVDPNEMLEEIGRRRGCLVSGGTVDLERAAGVLLRELRAGTLGRVSLEEPPRRPAPDAPKTQTPAKIDEDAKTEETTEPTEPTESAEA